MGESKEKEYKYLGKRCCTIDRDVAFDWCLELSDFATKFLEKPRREYKKLQEMIDEYEMRKCSMYGQAVNYDDGGLGCRVQTSVDNKFEKNMASLCDLEKKIEIQSMKFISSWLTVKNIIRRMPVKDRFNRDYVKNIIRKTMIEYYNPYIEAGSIAQIARDMQKDYNLVYHNYVRGEGSLEYEVARYVYGEDA